MLLVLAGLLGFAFSVPGKSKSKPKLHSRAYAYSQLFSRALLP